MDLRVRFVEQPMDETKANQTSSVQRNDCLRKASISDAGLTMMTAIVGKRLPRFLKENVGRALQDTIEGSFEDGEEMEGDVFASVYGEVLGPLFTCLERNGDFVVIRLLSPKGKRSLVKHADLMLFDRSSGLAMLQECKGHCCDYDSVEDSPDSFDVCQKTRVLISKGRRQLAWPDLGQLSARRVRISSREEGLALPVPHAEQSVVVTVVPDGRLKTPQFSLRPPDCANCTDEPCTACLFSPMPEQEPTLITILSTESIRDPESLDPSGRKFLDWYKACERSIWGRAHGSFGQAYSSLVGAWRQMDLPSQTRRVDVGLLTGIVEAAIDRRVFVDFRPIWHVCEETRLPEGLVTTLHALHDVQGEMPRPAMREGSAKQLGQLLFGSEGEHSSLERILGNWQFGVGGEGVSREGAGTPVEVCVIKPCSGALDLLVVPQGTDQSPSDLRWGLSEILAGGRIPPEIIYDAFAEEEVTWQNIETGESRRYSLGHTLQSPWFPLWPWLYDKRTLDHMLDCCPACHEMARMLMHWEEHWRHWPEPFLFHHHFRRHHHRYPWSHLAGFDHGPMAFVTSDSKAVLRIPYWE